MTKNEKITSATFGDGRGFVEVVDSGTGRSVTADQVARILVGSLSIDTALPRLNSAPPEENIIDSQQERVHRFDYFQLWKHFASGPEGSVPKAPVEGWKYYEEPKSS